MEKRRYSQCIFDSTDTSFGDEYPFLDKYPLMRVWFKVPTEGKRFFWVPKWEELYKILHYAVQVERKNFPRSSWNELLENLERVFKKDFRMPKRRFVGLSFRSEEFKEEDKKLLEKIKRHQSGEGDDEDGEENET